MEQCRIIFSLHLDIEPEPGSPPGASAALIVPLRRDGTAAGRNGRPRPPKLRSIDLRAGDAVVVEGRWRQVLGVRAYRDAHGTAEQMEAIRDGYLVKP